MPSMPVYFVGKGSQFAMLDRQFANPSGVNAALGWLASDDPLATLAGGHANPSSGMTPGLSKADVEHFRDHWLADWWPKLAVSEVLRAGYREAMELASRTSKPIDSIWVCANEKEFQLYICESDNQITVIVFTPPPPRHRFPSRKRQHSNEQLTETEPIWVVKVKDKFDDEYNQGSRDYKTVDAENQIIKRQIRYERR
jgi:hypothetical protein